jgi:hypothetical protein
LSALQEACSGLLAAFKDTSQLRDRLATEGRKLQASAQAAASAGRGAEDGRGVMAVAQALQMAATRCNAAVQQIEAAEEAGKRFVQRTVGGSYGGGGLDTDGAARAWAGMAPDSGLASGFSSDKVESCWSSGLETSGGRAYYDESENGHEMRGMASLLAPFPGEYTVDMHGSTAHVSVGGTQLDASELAELIRADQAWQGQPVRLFSCDTGKGSDPIAARLAHELGVQVTAPDALAYSNAMGESWVAAAWKDKDLGELVVRVPGKPGHWRTFDP